VQALPNRKYGVQICDAAAVGWAGILAIAIRGLRGLKHAEIGYETIETL